MTRFPTESRDVVGIQGYDQLKVGPVCAVPGCTRLTDHAHHLFSRGLMGGAFDWVRLPDGVETGNLVPLCYRHHDLVTDNRVKITYENDQFYWDEDEKGAVPLTEQPPKRGQPTPEPSEEKPVCTACGRPLPRPKIEGPAEEKKARKTWAVSVPNTVMEDGADVLDALLDAAREEMDKAGLDWGEGHRVKYHILATALALFVQNGEKILGDS